MDNERTLDNVWVIAYDPKTDERVDELRRPSEVSLRRPPTSPREGTRRARI